jgi:GntR family transcriptional regulator
MLQRSSPLPLYHQLKQLLADRIQRGEWKPGDLVPGEHELQDTFHLSRTTVRQAMQELEREGFVTRHRGRGTFVARPRAVHSPEPKASVSDFLLAQGIKPGWRVLTSGSEPAPLDVAARLQIDPGALAFCSRRLRLADDAPLGHLEAWAPTDLLPHIDPAMLAVGGSLEYLRAPGLLKGSRAERTLTAAAASELEADLLGVPVGAPLLKIQRITFAADGRVLEDFCGSYRGDRFRYRITPTHEPA